LTSGVQLVLPDWGGGGKKGRKQKEQEEADTERGQKWGKKDVVL